MIQSVLAPLQPSFPSKPLTSPLLHLHLPWNTCGFAADGNAALPAAKMSQFIFPSSASYYEAAEKEGKKKPHLAADLWQVPSCCGALSNMSTSMQITQEKANGEVQRQLALFDMVNIVLKAIYRVS